MKDHIQALKDITSVILDKAVEQERYNRRKDVLIEILTTLNFLDSERDSVERLLDIIQDYTSVEAVAFRLKHGDDYPYFASRGFSEEFLAKENSLRCQDEIFGEKESELECMCGCVVKGFCDNKCPFFTEFGSFYAPDTPGLVEGLYGPFPDGVNVRGVCVVEGYQTVVAIPLRCKSDRIIGLLQLNDKKKNAVSLETVKFFEGIGLNIGTALSRIRMLESLKERCTCRHDRSYESNELQPNGASA